jgi:hypothetical protein
LEGITEHGVEIKHVVRGRVFLIEKERIKSLKRLKRKKRKETIRKF